MSCYPHSTLQPLSGLVGPSLTSHFTVPSNCLGRYKYDRMNAAIAQKMKEGVVINTRIGTKYKNEMIKITGESFHEHLKEFGHTIDQIDADLARCAIKQDVKDDPELEQYRLQLVTDIEPVKRKIAELRNELPVEKEFRSNEKSNGKRPPTAMEAYEMKKQKMWVGAGGQEFARAH